VRSRGWTSITAALIVLAGLVGPVGSPAVASTVGNQSESAPVAVHDGRVLATSSVSAVSHLRVSHVTASTLILTWRLPAKPVVTGALVREAASRFAPSTPLKGLGLGNVARPGDKLVVSHLTASRWYSFAVFAHDAHGHFAKAASISVRTPEPSWSVVPSPNPATQNGDSLSGVACITSTDCFAVGSTGSSTLVVRWEGTSWSVVPSPSAPSPAFSSLAGITCTSATNCWAVGSTAVFSNGQFSGGSLIEHWDGAHWSIVPSPNAPSDRGMTTLSSVTCRSTTSCFAVGTTSPDADSAVVIERWNGARWTVTLGPPTPTTDGLTGIECESTIDCLAVGGPSEEGNYLIEHWNGSEWSLSASPEPTGSSVSYLGDVRCLNAMSCFAVGDSATGYMSQSYASRTLVEHWNGHTWAVFPSPSPSTESALGALSCPTATSCIALGSGLTKKGGAFIETWNGTSWSVRPGPKISGGQLLGGLACTGTSNCFAVGSSPGTGQGQTLIERYS